MKKLIDNGRSIFQIIVLVTSLFFPKVVNLSEVIRILFGGQSPDFSTAKYYYLMKSGNCTMGMLLALFVLFKLVRKSNEDKVLFNGNIYHDYSYAWFWFHSKILGYKKCNLVLVPIYTQFKLILRDTFIEYPFDEDVFLEIDCEVSVEKDLNKENVPSNEINLIIQDTYPINDNHIPSNIVSNNTIIVKRNIEEHGKKIYCKKLIDKVVNSISELPTNSTLNVFSTSNPKNTYYIVKKSTLSERGNVSHLNVFQQSKYGNRIFESRGYKIL